MDWAETNGSDVTTWSSRRPWDAATQQSGDQRTGVALEYMIELANELDADPWFNMPYQASDDFVRNFAIQVRDTLEPGRKVYVEWANETWNAGYGFEVYPWITAQLSRPENAALQGDRWALVAQETRRDFAIWSEVFAGQSQRLTRVVAGQEANSWIAQQIASHMQGQLDAISAAAYAFVSDADRAAFRATTTADQVIDALLRNLPTTFRWLTEHRQLADELAAQLGRPIELVAYEGGPHLDSWGAAYEPAFFAAGAHPRMYDVYSQLLDGSARSGVNRFVNYNYTGGRYPSSFGAFGALQAQNQPLAQAPKYRALLDYTPPPPTPPPPTPPPPTLTVPGLLGQYFDNRDFTALKMTRVDSYINFNWGLGAPDTSLGKDTFSVRWTGQLRVPQTGSYQFRTYSDEGIRLTLGGVTRIDNFKSHLGMYNSSAVLSLTAGQLLDVQLDYFENTGRAAVKLEWKRPGKAGFGEIPASQLQTVVPTNPVPTPPASAARQTAQFVEFDAVAVPTVPPTGVGEASIKANGYSLPTCNERAITLAWRRRRRASTHH
ncbi:MAG: PA14 domain-containing protein [Planctomycetota bacterium]